MGIFHYCAMRLKDVPLFESCSSTEIVREVTLDNSEVSVVEEVKSNEEQTNVKTSGISNVEVNESDLLQKVTDTHYSEHVTNETSTGAFLVPVTSSWKEGFGLQDTACVGKISL